MNRRSLFGFCLAPLVPAVKAAPVLTKPRMTAAEVELLARRYCDSWPSPLRNYVTGNSTVSWSYGPRHVPTRDLVAPMRGP